MTNAKVAVIGGGIAGLTVAFRLLQKGFKVKLFEALNTLGGLARTIEIEGRPVEIFYHHFFPGDGYFLRICKELGIADKIRWLNGKMGYLSNGELFDFGTPFSLLRFKSLSLMDKISFGKSVLKIKAEKSLEKMDQQTAEVWLIKNAGKKAFEMVWKPLLIQKFGDTYKEVPMAWLWKKIQMRSLAQKNIFGKEKLAYLVGSLEILIQKLREKIIQLGGEIALGQRVTKIEKEGQRKYKVITGNSEEEFEAIISTVAPPILDKLFSFPGGFNEVLKGFRQLGVVCILLVLKQPLTKYYWLNIGDNSFPFGLVVEHTNFCKPQDFDGGHLVYISKYVDAAHKLYSSFSDNELVDYFLKYLSRINPDFRRDWIEEVLVFREPYAQPIIETGYLKRKPGYGTTAPNFYWISSNHIYPEDRGINASIREGEKVAGIAAQSFKKNQLL